MKSRLRTGVAAVDACVPGGAAARWRVARGVAVLCYLGALAYSVANHGVPIFRLSVVAWTFGAFAVYAIGRDRWLLPRALRDWLPFTAVMMCYDLSRGVADKLGFTVHVTWPAAADRLLFGAIPTVWLQARLHTPGLVYWYDVAASLVYFSFFFVVPVVMAVLWIRDRPLWRRFMATVVTLSFVSLVTFTVFPEAPPWYAAQAQVIDPVDRISSLGWTALGLRAATELINEGQSVANDVAAMPSLHMGYTTVVALFFLTRVPRRLRPLLVCYPIAMGLTLVYTGEHWVVDIIAGVAVATAIHLAVSAVFDRRDARRAARVAESGDREPVPAAENLLPESASVA
jgi:membrane-associated phospholipid phosphatase